MSLGLCLFLAHPAPAREAAFQAGGDWTPLEAVADHDPASVARWTGVDTPMLFMLMENESVLGGIELVNAGGVDALTVQVSQDAVNWSPPLLLHSAASTVKGARAWKFAATQARAVRVFLNPADAPTSCSLGELLLHEAAAKTPEILDLRFENVRENSVEVDWRTDFPAKAALIYGFSPDRMKTLTTPSFEIETKHHVKLEGLYPGTPYQVWVVIDDKPTGLAPDRPFTFRTAGNPFPTAEAAKISAGRDTALLEFVSNIPTTAILEIGRENPRRITPRSSGLETRHLFSVNNLAPRLTFEYRIIVKDAEGRTTSLPWAEFTTAPLNVAAGLACDGTFNLLLPDQEVEDTRPSLERITDGRNDYFRGMATSHDPSETAQWALVDLGEEFELESIETVWRGNAYPTLFQVLGSADGKEWGYFGFNLNAGEGRSEVSSRGDPLLRVVTPVDGAKIRYLKVLVPKGRNIFVKSPSWRFVQLAEIEAHARWKYK